VGGCPRALSLFDQFRVDRVGVRLAWFGHSADQVVILKACLALFALDFEVSFELGDLEVCIISGFGEDQGGVVTDLLKVLFKGLVGYGKLLFIGGMGIFGCLHHGFCFGLEFALFGEAFDPFDNMGSAEKEGGWLLMMSRTIWSCALRHVLLVQVMALL
jgi:hypothetical protein